MSNHSRRLLLIGALMGSLALAGCNKGGTAGPAEGDMSLGDPKAKVKVVEYASASCSHCASFNNDVMPAFKAKYIDTGKVHYTLKEFLTPPTPVAAAGFLIARCAGKEKYFSVIDAVFHSQNEMFSSGDYKGVLLRIGRSVGMNDDQTMACIQDDKALKALNDRVEKALNVQKVAATPTFYIGDKKLEGEQPLSAFDAVLQPLLAAK